MYSLYVHCLFCLSNMMLISKLKKSGWFEIVFIDKIISVGLNLSHSVRRKHGGINPYNPDAQGQNPPIFRSHYANGCCYENASSQRKKTKRIEIKKKRKKSLLRGQKISLRKGKWFQILPGKKSLGKSWERGKEPESKSRAIINARVHFYRFCLRFMGSGGVRRKMLDHRLCVRCCYMCEGVRACLRLRLRSRACACAQGTGGDCGNWLDRRTGKKDFWVLRSVEKRIIGFLATWLMVAGKNALFLFFFFLFMLFRRK